MRRLLREQQHNSASEGGSQSVDGVAPSTPSEALRPATVDVGGWTVPSEVGGWFLVTNEDIGRYGAENGGYPQQFLVDFQGFGFLQPPSQGEVATFDAYGPINAHYTTIGRGDAQALAFYARSLDAFLSGQESPTLVSRATGTGMPEMPQPECREGSFVVCMSVVNGVVYEAQAPAASMVEAGDLLAALVVTQ